jgi:hypothetical protein
MTEITQWIVASTNTTEHKQFGSGNMLQHPAISKGGHSNG